MNPAQDQKGKRKQTQESRATSEQPKAKRLLPPRSEVWVHFTRQEDNHDKCVCHYSNKDYTCRLTKSETKKLVE